MFAPHNLPLVAYTIYREMEFNKNKCKVLNVGQELSCIYRLAKKIYLAQPWKKKKLAQTIQWSK